ncbi:MAG: response regulator [Planctomycetota bacterium]|nr:response regulator [Planctomycetota bacterium]
MNDCIVHVVDDDPGVLSSVQGILSSAGISARIYHSAEEFIGRHSAANAGACLILDLRMPGMKGPELIEWLRAGRIEMPIIILSSHGDVPSVVESMKMGAAEFLEKPPDPLVLIEKVRRLLQAAVERSAARIKIQEIRDDFAKLTQREREMVELLANGLSSKEIAANIGISVKTVENHRSHVLAKTRAANVASLVRMKMMVS